METSEVIALIAILVALLLAFAAHMKSQGAQTAILGEVRDRLQKQSDKISSNTKGLAQLNILVPQLVKAVEELTESNGKT